MILLPRSPEQQGRQCCAIWLGILWSFLTRIKNFMVACGQARLRSAPELDSTHQCAPEPRARYSRIVRFSVCFCVFVPLALSRQIVHNAGVCSLRVASAGWILTAGILDPLIQGLKDADRERPGKAPIGIGFLGSWTVLASRKVAILYFIFLIAFLFQVWGWSPGPWLLSHTLAQQMAFLKGVLWVQGLLWRVGSQDSPPHRPQHSGTELRTSVRSHRITTG